MEKRTLREAREAAGFTTEEAAAVAKAKPKTYERLEAAPEGFTVTQALALCRAFGVSVDGIGWGAGEARC